MKFFCFAAFAICVPLMTSHATPADHEFEKLAATYIEARLTTHPEEATELGDHRFDGKLTDYSAVARAEELTAQKGFLAKLESFADKSELTGANSVDFRILKENVAGEIFSLEQLKEAEWNPLVYNQSLANGVYLLIARELDRKSVV